MNAPVVHPADQNVAQLRDRAARLLELARRVRAENRPDFANLLTQLAVEASEQADEMELRSAAMARNVYHVIS